MRSSRRSFLKGSAAAAAVAVIGKSFVPTLLRGKPFAAGNPLRSLPDFTGGELAAAPGSAMLWPGRETAVYGLNGSYLGPTIRLNRGEDFAALLRNGLENEDLILHWHGLFAPEEMDGHPRFAVPSGGTYDYHFPVNQRAATCWYHSHTDMRTGPQVYKGLAGFFIVHDEEEQGLGLPSGEYDVPLAIQDKRVTTDFQLEYAPNQIDMMRGWQGDTIFVNGTPDAVLGVAQTLYRFRILNAANARVWKIAFSDQRSFHVIAGDGGLLAAPAEANSFFLPPGARVEILVDFSGDGIGTELILQSLEFDGDTIPGTRQGNPADLMRFLVDRTGPTANAIPGTLSSIPMFDPSQAVRTRNFRTHAVNQKHAINDLIFEMMRIDFEVAMGEVEMWEFFNPSQEIHPMHVHGVHFQVVNRNGSTNIAPEERGWKDTILLLPYDRVQVLLRFDAYPGMFLLHCHNLEHEDDGMMLNFQVTPPASVGRSDNATGGLHAWPNPASDRTTLRFPSASTARQLNITDERGRSLLRYSIPARSEHFELDLAELSSGNYWCRIGWEAILVKVAR